MARRNFAACRPHRQYGLRRIDNSRFLGGCAVMPFSDGRRKAISAHGEPTREVLVELSADHESDSYLAPRRVS